MKTREIREKSIDELKIMYDDLCQKRQSMSFKIANNQNKNVRELRDIKKTIAKILTIIKEKNQK